MAAIKSIEKAWGANEMEVAMLLGVNIRTLPNLTKKPRLNEQLSDRALQLTRLMNEAVEYFDSLEVAQKWMHSPNIVLGDVKPISLCNKVTGMLMVRDVLNRLRSGMTA